MSQNLGRSLKGRVEESSSRDTSDVVLQTPFPCRGCLVVASTTDDTFDVAQFCLICVYDNMVMLSLLSTTQTI